MNNINNGTVKNFGLSLSVEILGLSLSQHNSRSKLIDTGRWRRQWPAQVYVRRNSVVIFYSISSKNCWSNSLSNLELEKRFRHLIGDGYNKKISSLVIVVNKQMPWVGLNSGPDVHWRIQGREGSGPSGGGKTPMPYYVDVYIPQQWCLCSLSCVLEVEDKVESLSTGKNEWESGSPRARESCIPL
jgi:hypothetical protein